MTIELNPITSGYSTGLINDNFQALEDYVNDYLLHRDGVETGQPNQMELPLDMNGFPILNASVDFSEPSSLLTLEGGDSRYVNSSGDTMQGSLNMASYPVFVRIAVNGNEPARKDELDSEASTRASADAHLQSQISGGEPLEASAFSPISWHKQIIESSVTIPEDQNAWSFGPEVEIGVGNTVTISEGSFWTIANGVTVS